jgi:hypothetical protein
LCRDHFLFRSEEHVTTWSFYNPDSYQAIMPIADWAYALGAGVFSRRLDADYLDHIGPYFDEFFERLAGFDRVGDFWRLEE